MWTKGGIFFFNSLPRSSGMFLSDAVGMRVGNPTSNLYSKHHAGWESCMVPCRSSACTALILWGCWCRCFCCWGKAYQRWIPPFRTTLTLSGPTEKQPDPQRPPCACKDKQCVIIMTLILTLQALLKGSRGPLGAHRSHWKNHYYIRGKNEQWRGNGTFNLWPFHPPHLLHSKRPIPPKPMSALN